MSLVLACDLGSTSMRAGLIDAAGEIRYRAAVDGPSIRRTGDGMETGVDAWWAQFCSVIDTLAEVSGEDFDAVKAVAITGVTRTLILLDRRLRPVRPAILWGDGRAKDVAAAFRPTVPQGHPELPQFNAFHPVARLCWLRCEEPDSFAAVSVVLEPKDYFNFRLTGEPATDCVSSARLIAAAEAHDGHASLIELAGIDPAIVPRALDPSDVVGQVIAGLPGALARLRGRPVVCMAHDTWASVLGLGALRPGFGYNLSGTTEVLGVISETQAWADGLLSVKWGQSLYQLGGPSQNGADTVVWALDVLAGGSGGAGDVGNALDRLLAERQDGQPLLFLPYLQGERTPYWNPALRGAFVGLHRDHRTGDCAFAVLEGVAFLNRIILERAESAVGRAVREIRFGGGGSASPVWAQIKADICERTIAVTDCREPGLLGGAIVAWQAVGEVASLEDGQARLVSVARHHEPNAPRRSRCRRLYDLFRRTEAALAPISEELARLDGNSSVAES